MPQDVYRDHTGKVMVSRALAEAIDKYRAAQDAARGEWPAQMFPMEDGEEGFRVPPFPERDNSMLEWLIKLGIGNVELGEDSVRTMMGWVAVHAWAEGHAEGYDRGQREARAELER